MNKKLLGLLLTFAVANPMVAGCDKAKEHAMNIAAFPLQLIKCGNDNLADAIYKKCNDSAMPVYAIGIGGKFLVIGAAAIATTGIIAAVKHYKKKKQALNKQAASINS